MSQKIYKQDSKGKTRVWFMEQDGDKHRTHDGILGGTVKCSAWRVAKPTNVGRSNERDGDAQAAFEIEAGYTKQLKGAYYYDIGDIGLGCRFIEPMLAETYERFAPGEAQPKLDGFRCILRRDGGWSREGEELPGTRHLVRALNERGAFNNNPCLSIDGELYNALYKHDFGKLSSLIKKQNPTPEELIIIERDVQFHAYDLLSISDYPFKLLSNKPRRERRDDLGILIPWINSPMFQLVPSLDVETEEEYDTFHAERVAEGDEGSMWRPHDGLYEIGKRSKTLQKRKDFDDAEFDIIPGGIEEGEGNWAGSAKRVVCWLPNADRSIDLTDGKARLENTFEAGLRGTYGDNQKLLADADNQHVVTIRFFGWTTTDTPKPRFGIATRFHGPTRTL